MSIIHLLELGFILIAAIWLAWLAITLLFVLFSIGGTGVAASFRKNKLLGFGISAILLIGLVIGITSLYSNNKSTHKTQIVSPSDYCKIDESKFVNQLNTLRQSLNLQPVTEVADMDTVAKSRINDMLANHYYGHYNPQTQESVATEIQSKTKYENYAEILDGPLRADDAFTDFKNSPDHYSIMVNPDIRYIGISSAYQPDNVNQYDNNGKPIPNSGGSQFCMVEVPVAY